MKYEINAEKNARTPKPPYRNEGRQILIHSERIVLTSPGVLASELVVLVVRAVVMMSLRLFVVGLGSQRARRRCRR